MGVPITRTARENVWNCWKADWRDNKLCCLRSYASLFSIHVFINLLLLYIWHVQCALCIISIMQSRTGEIWIKDEHSDKHTNWVHWSAWKVYTTNAFGNRRAYRDWTVNETILLQLFRPAEDRHAIVQAPLIFSCDSHITCAHHFFHSSK